MNIFALDTNPKIAARYQVDKHVVKMVLETAQLLSTCHRVLDSEWAELVYKKTHVNHPCSIWVRESSENYNWLLEHFVYLLEEYTFRYGKVHKCSEYLHILKNNPVDSDPLTLFALAMPDEYKMDCPVLSYRKYYINAKSALFSWTRRELPDWLHKTLDNNYQLVL